MLVPSVLVAMACAGLACGPATPAGAPSVAVTNMAAHDAAQVDAGRDQSDIDARAIDARAIDARASIADAAPRPIRAHVITIQNEKRQRLIGLDRGARHGVYVGQRGHLVDETGSHVPNSDFVVDEVTEQSAKARIVVPAEVIQKNAKVELFP